MPAAPLLLDFATLGDDPGQAMFGDFDMQLSGGTFYYPDSPDPFALRSDVTGGNWRIQGPVGSSAGFGLFFYQCQRLDASRFGGIAFRIRGNVARGEQVTLLVGTASNQVARDWLVQSGTDPNAPVSFGRCEPAATRFDGSCNSAQVAVPVVAGQRDVLVPFTAFAQGSPEPGVNPAEITSIQWSLPRPATAADGTPVPYAVDLRIDDIRFVQ